MSAQPENLNLETANPSELVEHSSLYPPPTSEQIAARQARREQAAAELSNLLPASSVLWREEQLRPYESDGLTAIKATPLLVVLPETIEQVQAIMRWATETQTAVVARGAGTGLSGGALPHADGLLLGLAKFNKILELNAERGFARVQPGVRNLAISDAARPHGKTRAVFTV